MMTVSKAIVIREPYIDFILRGEKIWEMRSRVCKVRGRVGLIRQGSGLIIGTAVVVDCLPRLDTLAELAETFLFHRIASVDQEEAFERKWTTPWVLSDIRTLPEPVAYEHGRGAVTWVTLAPDVSARVEMQTGLPARAA
jgi:hypothetical protein